MSGRAATEPGLSPPKLLLLPRSDSAAAHGRAQHRAVADRSKEQLAWQQRPPTASPVGSDAALPGAQVSTDRRCSATHVGPLDLKTLILAQP